MMTEKFRLYPFYNQPSGEINLVDIDFMSLPSIPANVPEIPADIKARADSGELQPLLYRLGPDAFTEDLYLLEPQLIQDKFLFLIPVSEKRKKYLPGIKIGIRESTVILSFEINESGKTKPVYCGIFPSHSLIGTRFPWEPDNYLTGQSCELPVKSGELALIQLGKTSPPLIMISNMGKDPQNDLTVDLSIHPGIINVVKY